MGTGGRGSCPLSMFKILTIDRPYGVDLYSMLWRETASKHTFPSLPIFCTFLHLCPTRQTQEDITLRPMKQLQHCRCQTENEHALVLGVDSTVNLFINFSLKCLTSGAYPPQMPVINRSVITTKMHRESWLAAERNKIATQINIHKTQQSTTIHNRHTKIHNKSLVSH